MINFKKCSYFRLKVTEIVLRSLPKEIWPRVGRTFSLQQSCVARVDDSVCSIGCVKLFTNRHNMHLDGAFRQSKRGRDLLVFFTFAQITQYRHLSRTERPRVALMFFVILAGQVQWHVCFARMDKADRISQ